MKKSAKILTLVLSLALICGALVVAALAADDAEITGVVSCFSTDFTNGSSIGAKSGTVVTDFQIDNKGSGSSSIQIGQYDGNSYFSFSYKEKPGNATATNYAYTAPYSGTAFKKIPATEPHFFKDYYWKNNSYYVVDIDVWFPEAVPSNAARIYMFNYYLPEIKEGATEFANATEASNVIAWNFRNATDGGVNLLTGSGSYYPMLDSTWNHITAIVESKVVDNSVVLTCYTALNGTIIDKFDYTLDANAVKTDSPLAYENDWTNWFPKNVRIDLGKDDTANTMNIDNYSIRRITSDYNGNLATVLAGGVGASIEAWESNVYDEAKMPFALPVAYVGEQAYDNLQKAVNAANDGDVIVLSANAYGVSLG